MISEDFLYSMNVYIRATKSDTNLIWYGWLYVKEIAIMVSSFSMQSQTNNITWEFCSKPMFTLHNTIHGVSWWFDSDIKLSHNAL